MKLHEASRLCIYCGGEIKNVKKGEHIVPKALGCSLAIKTVCGKCNNLFSEIDTALCSRSLLSVIASQEIDSHLWQVWDVDHSAHNLLPEARSNWASENMAVYPQVIFDRRRLQVSPARSGLDKYQRGRRLAV